MRKMKIAILGPHGAGKSTLIRKLDPNALMIKYPKDLSSPTIGFDYGVVLWDATENKLFRKDEIDRIDFTDEIWKVTLVSTTPGQTSLNPLKKVLGDGVDGVIIILDSSNPAQIIYGLSLYEDMQKFFGKEVPFLILANKQDLRSDRSSAILGAILRENVEIKPVSILKDPKITEIVLEFLKKVRSYVLKKSIQEALNGALYQQRPDESKRREVKLAING